MEKFIFEKSVFLLPDHCISVHLKLCTISPLSLYIFKEILMIITQSWYLKENILWRFWDSLNKNLCIYSWIHMATFPTILVVCRWNWWLLIYRRRHKKYGKFVTLLVSDFEIRLSDLSSVQKRERYMVPKSICQLQNIPRGLSSYHLFICHIFVSKCRPKE